MDYRKAQLSDFTREHYISAARIKKASGMADAIQWMIDTNRMTWDDVKQASDDTKAILAKLGGVNPPGSEISWQHALRIYRRRTREKVS